MILHRSSAIYEFLALIMLMLDRLMKTHIPLNIRMLPSLSWHTTTFLNSLCYNFETQYHYSTSYLKETECAVNMKAY